MTKLEYGKCERLMEEAIRKAEQANEEYKESVRYLCVGKRTTGEIERRKADQHYGYAGGIKQALVALGFKHDRMKELADLL